MSDVAKRYARAVVEAALDAGGEGSVMQMAKGLRGFAEAYEASDDLRALMANPALKDSRDPVLKEVGKKLGLPEMAITLVRILADNERMDALAEVVMQVESLADEAFGRARAVVFSAIEVEDAQKERIAKALGKRLGKPVSITVEIDPSILGGLVCQVGDLTIDNSVRRQLEIVSERLYGAEL